MGDGAFAPRSWVGHESTLAGHETMLWHKQDRLEAANVFLENIELGGDPNGVLQEALWDHGPDGSVDCPMTILSAGGTLSFHVKNRFQVNSNKLLRQLQKVKLRLNEPSTISRVGVKSAPAAPSSFSSFVLPVHEGAPSGAPAAPRAPSLSLGSAAASSSSSSASGSASASTALPLLPSALGSVTYPPEQRALEAAQFLLSIELQPSDISISHLRSQPKQSHKDLSMSISRGSSLSPARHGGTISMSRIFPIYSASALTTVGSWAPTHQVANVTVQVREKPSHLPERNSSTRSSERTDMGAREERQDSRHRATHDDDSRVSDNSEGSGEDPDDADIGRDDSRLTEVVSIVVDDLQASDNESRHEASVDAPDVAMPFPKKNNHLFPARHLAVSLHSRSVPCSPALPCTPPRRAVDIATLVDLPTLASLHRDAHVCDKDDDLILVKKHDTSKPTPAKNDALELLTNSLPTAEPPAIALPGEQTPQPSPASQDVSMVSQPTSTTAKVPAATVAPAPLPLARFLTESAEKRETADTHQQATKRRRWSLQDTSEFLNCHNPRGPTRKQQRQEGEHVRLALKEQVKLAQRSWKAGHAKNRGHRPGVQRLQPKEDKLSTTSEAEQRISGSQGQGKGRNRRPSASDDTQKVEKPKRRVCPLVLEPPPVHCDRHWQRSVLNRGLLNSRVYLSGNKACCPVVLSSLTSFISDSKRTAGSPPPPINHKYFRKISGWSKRHGVSYKHLLTKEVDNYEPDYLIDDNDIKSGKHRVVMSLPGFLESVIWYVRAKELKQELNRQFRHKHPWIQATLTLSKIRRIRQLMLQVAISLNLEMSTTALAYIYFQRLCIKNVIMKTNRKVAAAACLMLAYKFNEKIVTGVEDDGGATKQKLQTLLDCLEKVLLVKKKELLLSEFGILVSLDFTLHAHIDDVRWHFHRMLQDEDVDSEEYANVGWSLRPDTMVSLETAQYQESSKPLKYVLDSKQRQQQQGKLHVKLPGKLQGKRGKARRQPNSKLRQRTYAKQFHLAR